MQTTNEYPFPFLGAGTGRYGYYYNFLKLLIKFEEAPDDTTKKKIAESYPIPFNKNQDDSFSVEFFGPFFMLQEKKRLENHIKNTYETVEAFENAVESWLCEVHSYAPIEMVIRPYHEAAQLSAWHENSRKLIPELIVGLEYSAFSAVNNKESFGDNPERWKGFRLLNIIKAALTEYFQIYDYDEYSDEKEEAIKKELLALSPSCYACLLTNEWDYEELLDLMHRNRENHRLLTDIAGCIAQSMWVYETRTDSSGIDNEGFQEVYDCLLNSAAEIPLKEIEPKNIYNKLVKALENKDTNRVRMIAEKIWSLGHLKGAVTWFYVYHTALKELMELSQTQNNVITAKKIPKNKWMLFLDVYEFIIDNIGNECIDPSFFCNALYACTTGNTGLPVDMRRNRKFLNYCLSHAYANTTTYYNAGCVYNNMGEYDKALECFQKYFEQRKEKEYKEERKMFTTELRVDKEFNDFRQHPGVAEFIGKIK